MAVIYLDAIAGNDTNSGLRPSSPLKTLTPLQALITAHKIGQGDACLFKGGRDYFGNLTFPVGDPLKPQLVLGQWGDGERFRINAYKVLNVSGGWSLHASGVWKIDLTATSGTAGNYTGNITNPSIDVGFLLVDGEIEGRQKNSLGALAQQWDFYSDQTQWLYVKSSANPVSLTDDLRAAPRGNVVTGQTGLTMTGFELLGSGSHGYRQIGVGTVGIANTELSDFWIHEIGGAHLYPGDPDTSRLGNAVELWINSENFRGEGGEISDVYDVAFTCQGVATTGAQNNWTDILLQTTRIWNCNQTFEFWSSAGSATGTLRGSERVKLLDNIALNGGYSWGNPVRADTVGKANHVMTYDMGLPTDIEIAGNVFFGAGQNYSYHRANSNTDLTVPAGFNSHDNTIFMETGGLLQWSSPGLAGGDPYPIENAAAWQSYAGTEQGSTFSIIPAELNLDSVSAQDALEVAMAYLLSSGTLTEHTARVGMKAAAHSMGRVARLEAQVAKMYETPLQIDRWYAPSYGGTAVTIAGSNVGGGTANAYRGKPIRMTGSGYIDGLAVNVTTAGTSGKQVYLACLLLVGDIWIRVAGHQGVLADTTGVKTVTLTPPFRVSQGDLLLPLVSFPDNASSPALRAAQGTNDASIPVDTSGLSYLFENKPSGHQISGVPLGATVTAPGLTDLTPIVMVHVKA